MTRVDVKNSVSRRLFEAPSATAVRENAAATLRGMIQSGQFALEGPLPPERELASHLGISRPTLRLVLRDFEDEGLIKLSGKSRRIAADPAADGQTAGREGVLAHTVILLSDRDLADPFDQTHAASLNTAISAGLIQAAHAASLNVMTLTPGRMDEAQVARLLAGRPHGIVLMRDFSMSESGATLLDRFSEAGLPVVVYGDDPRCEDFDRVTSDHAEGSCQATRRLIELGCRRLVRYWEFRWGERQDYEWVRRRDIGFERAMLEAGLEIVPAVTTTTPPPGDVDATRIEWKARLALGCLYEYVSGDKRVDGVVTLNDGAFFSVARAMQIAGLDPQRDVLIAGYDNFYAVASERKVLPLAPRVTVDKNNLQIGRALIDLLQQRIAGELPEAPQRRVIQPTLVTPE